MKETHPNVEARAAESVALLNAGGLGSQLCLLDRRHVPTGPLPITNTSLSSSEVAWDVRKGQ